MTLPLNIKPVRLTNNVFPPEFSIHYAYNEVEKTWSSIEIASSSTPSKDMEMPLLFSTHDKYLWIYYPQKQREGCYPFLGLGNEPIAASVGNNKIKILP